MNEIFVPIKDYEGLYEISNFGRVKSCAKTWIGGKGAIRRKGETIMKNSFKGNGYLGLKLCDMGIGKTIQTHILVWEHFGEGKRNGFEIQVDHIDEDKLNNRIDNLQLLTARENSVKYRKTQETSSKYTGVNWETRDKIWKAHIEINGKSKHLGLFINEEDAHREYQRALKEFNETGRITVNTPMMQRKTSQYRGVAWNKRDE